MWKQENKLEDNNNNADEKIILICTKIVAIEVKSGLGPDIF